MRSDLLEDLQKVYMWLCVNCLSTNLNVMCKYMITSKYIDIENTDADISMISQKLAILKEIKYLDVIINK